MNSAIWNVNLDVTSACDRACPDCCCNILNRPAVHHDWAYFECAAKALYGIKSVALVGGEPTIHPQFAEFIPRFKALFGCEQIILVTNGWGVVRYRDVIARHVDRIQFSDYHTEISIAAWAAIQAMPITDVSVFDAGPHQENFTPRSRRGGGNPCERAWWHGTIAYADGKIYGCCVAPGIEGAIGIEPEGWDGEPSAPPCEECFFSV